MKTVVVQGALWQNNLHIGIATNEMRIWLFENLGHQDPMKEEQRNKKYKRVDKDKYSYFFWGDGHIQFKIEEDMVKFILRFA